MDVTCERRRTSRPSRNMPCDEGVHFAMTGGEQGTGDSPTRDPAGEFRLPPGTRLVKVRRATPLQHVGFWFLGVVVASLIPFLPVLVSWVDGRSDHGGFYEALGRGELLAIALVISLGGVADLSPAMGAVERIAEAAFLLLGAGLMGLGEAIWYTDVALNLLDDRHVPLNHLAWGSLGFFVVSAGISLRSVHIAASSR
jgi:hypothetical protein